MGPEIKTILLAIAPINELRGTIPIALAFFHFSPLKALLLAYIGNMIPVFLLLLFWKRLAWILTRRFKLFDRFFFWLFERTRKRIYNKYKVWGDIALVCFVAIPLPITGAWIGTVAAFLLGVPYWKAVGLIFLGVIISGIIVTLASLGISSLI